MPSRYVITAFALAALIGLIWATLQFGPDPPPKVDRQKPPENNPLAVAGGGAPIPPDDRVPSLTEEVLQWKIAAPFEPIEGIARGATLPLYQQLSTQELTENVYPDQSLVIGVHRNGEARAYALTVFQSEWPSVLNDTLGGDPIAVSVCPLSGSTLAVSRRAAGIELTLSDSGATWRGNVVWRDAETGTEWSQMLARGMRGQLVDVELETLPVAMVSWQEWLRRFPETTLVVTTSSDASTATSSLEAFDDKNFGIGVRLGAKEAFYSIADLNQIPLRREEIQGFPLVIVYVPGPGTLAAFHRNSRIQDFEFDDQGRFVDRVAGTTWDLLNGSAVAGRQAGERLRPLRYQWCSKEGWSAFFQPSD